MSFGRQQQRKPLPTMTLPTARSAPGLNLSSQMILVMGQRGTGKSTLLNTEAPNSTLFLSTHEGLGSISCFSVQVNDLNEVRAVLKMLLSPDGADAQRFTHIVIDEIDDLYKWMMDEVLQERGLRNMAQVTSDDSPGIYADASAKLNTLMLTLRRLPQSVRMTSGERLNEPRGKNKGKLPVTISCGMSGSPRRVVAKHVDHMWRLRFDTKGNNRVLDLVGHDVGGVVIECKARLPDSAKGSLPRSIPMTDDGQPLPFAHIVRTFEAAMRGPGEV